MSVWVAWVVKLAEWLSCWVSSCMSNRAGRVAELLSHQVIESPSRRVAWVTEWLSGLSCRVARVVESLVWPSRPCGRVTRVAEWLSRLSRRATEWKELSKPIFDIVFLKQIRPLQRCFKVTIDMCFSKYNGRTTYVTKHGLFTATEHTPEYYHGRTAEQVCSVWRRRTRGNEVEWRTRL